jgi:hypothetical protein
LVVGGVIFTDASSLRISSAVRSTGAAIEIDAPVTRHKTSFRLRVSIGASPREEDAVRGPEPGPRNVWTR